MAHAPVREFIGILEDRCPVMGDSWLLTFTAPVEILREARAGHFINILVRPAGSWDPLLRRPFSLYAVDVTSHTMTILVRPYGRGTQALVERPLGSEMDVLGLLGNTFRVLPKSDHLLMVAGGVGAAPLLMLAREAVLRGQAVTWLLGARCADQLLPADELPSEVEYVIATEDGSVGYHGFVTDLVPQYIPWADQIFACGPMPMFTSLRNQVLQHRIGRRPGVQLSVERTMACGVGACLGCVVETRRGMRTSCVDGPVFDMEELQW